MHTDKDLPKAIIDQATLADGFAVVKSVYDVGDMDPYELYRECREQTPVMEGDLLARYGVPSQADFSNTGRKVYTLFRYADIQHVLRDTATYSSSLMMEGIGEVIGDVMLTGLDGLDHRRLRDLIQPAFAPSSMKRWTQMMQECMRSNFIEPLVVQRKCDLVAQFSAPFPVRIVYEILGFPTDPEATEKFASLAMRVLAGPQPDPEKAAESMRQAYIAAEALYQHIRPIVAQRRAEGCVGDDMMAHLLRAEENGRPAFDDHQVTNLIRMQLTAATETTTRAFGNMVVLLLRRPELFERVRNDRSLVPRVITESLRYETVAAFLARIVTRDTEICGVHIPAGTALSLAMGSANRDSAVFEYGDTFDIDRPQKPNAAFGLGVHTCIGAPVARLEMDVALNALLDSMPDLRFDPSYPPAIIRGLQLRGPEEIRVVWS